MQFEPLRGSVVREPERSVLVVVRRGAVRAPRESRRTWRDAPDRVSRLEIRNPNATKAAKITIYASPAPGGAVIDTIMAACSTAIQPMDDAGRKACAFGVNEWPFLGSRRSSLCRIGALLGLHKVDRNGSNAIVY